VLPLALGFFCLSLVSLAIVVGIEGPSRLYRPAS
jgi:hypothetical protein